MGWLPLVADGSPPANFSPAVSARKDRTWPDTCAADRRRLTTQDVPWRRRRDFGPHPTAAIAARRNDECQLNPVEGVESRDLFGREERFKAIVEFVRAGPKMLQPFDFQLDAICIDPPLRRQGRHASNAGCQITEILAVVGQIRQREGPQVQSGIKIVTYCEMAAANRSVLAAARVRATGGN